MKPGQLRRAMVAGIAFVVLFLVGVILNFSNTPETKSSETSAAVAQKWVSYLSSSSHRTSLLVSGYLLILAGLAFVWFTIGLRAWLARDAAVGRLISNLGVLGAGAMAAAAMGGTAVAGGVAFGNEAVPQSGDAIRVVMGMFYPFLFVVFGLTSALLIATVAVTARRNGALPRWLAYAGWLAVLGCLAGVFGPPFILVVLWYLAVSIVGLTRASSASAVAAAPPT
jgi:hypothetical protein